MFFFNWISLNANMNAIYHQYVAPLVPFVLFASMLGTKRLLQWLERRLGKLCWTLVVIGLLTCDLAAFWWDNPFTKPVLPPFAPVYALEPKPNLDEFKEASRLVPADAPLETMMTWAPHFSQRRYIYVMDWISPNLLPSEGRAEYILLDLRDRRWRADPGWRALQALEQGYGVRYFDNDVLLLEADVPVTEGERTRIQDYVDAISADDVTSLE